MLKSLLSAWLIVLFLGSGAAQPRDKSIFPVEHCIVKYSFSGNTEGYRDLYFSDYGNKMAVFTNFTRSTTFYSITTSSIENVAEFLLNGQYYHFDLENKKGHLIEPPAHMISKYVYTREPKADYRTDLENAGAILTGTKRILDIDCEAWQYYNKEFLIWEGILLRVSSRGLKKNFIMEVTSIDFESNIDESVFSFPENIPLPK
jgi:hypothetical protein